MKISYSGILVQFALWFLVYSIYFSEKRDGRSILLIFIFFIVFFGYLYKYLLSSQLYIALSSKNIKRENSLEDLLNRLVASKPYLKIDSCTFSDSENSKTATNFSTKKTEYFEFFNVKDHSIFYDKEKITSENCLIFFNFKLFVHFNDPSCKEEINEVIRTVKSEISCIDKYSEVNHSYILKDNELDYSIIQLGNRSVVLNPLAMIIFYVLLLGEFYKIVVASEINVLDFEIVKQVSRHEETLKLGRLISEKGDCLAKLEKILTPVSISRKLNFNLQETQNLAQPELTPEANDDEKANLIVQGNQELLANAHLLLIKRDCESTSQITFGPDKVKVVPSINLENVEKEKEEVDNLNEFTNSNEDVAISSLQSPREKEENEYLVDDEDYSETIDDGIFDMFDNANHAHNNKKVSILKPNQENSKNSRIKKIGDIKKVPKKK